MIVLCVTNCPARLRGDLSKWFLEINAGVYIGKTSARVRDELWKRVRNSITDGQATMIYSSNNAQGYSVRVHNSKWKPVDYEGITLMRKPISSLEIAETKKNELKEGFSDAAKWQMHKSKRKKVSNIKNFVVIDLETTGLNARDDHIIEIGAIKKYDGQEERFQVLIRYNKEIPQEITSITGITHEMLMDKGIEETKAITELQDFIGQLLVVGYNVQFDLEFIREACIRNNISYHILKAQDIIPVARKKIAYLTNYKMTTVAEALQIKSVERHRAMADCEIALRIFEKLNEI